MTVANELFLSADGLERLKKEEAVIDGLYADQSGYCTFGVGHLVHPSDKWGCFMLEAAAADENWKASVSTKWPGKAYELKYLAGSTAFKEKFDELKTKAIEVAKTAIAAKKHNKTFDKLTKAEQDAITTLATDAINEQARLLAKTADDVLKADLVPYETAVRSNITVKLSQEEFDALVSLCFNIGVGAFGSSDVTKEINKDKHNSGEAKDRKTAIAAIETAFGKHNKSKGVVLDDLTKRRKAESDLFLTGARAALAELEKAAGEKTIGAPAAVGGPAPVAGPAKVSGPAAVGGPAPVK